MTTFEIIIVVLASIGSVFNARKSRKGLACWFIADLLSVPFFYVHHLYGLMWLNAFWTILSAYGFYYWGKNERTHL